jgi:hypothetical protein
MEQTELHPWPVLRAITLELSSYEVPKVIDFAGLQVDWTLSDEQNYSNKTRIAAYRPRIDSAYADLSGEASLRAAYVITDQLIRRGHSERVDSALRAIGWKLTDGKLAPESESVQELFFPIRSHHDAYTEIRAILREAFSAIEVVDPYIDQTVLTLLGTAARQGMSIHVLTSKVPHDLGLEIMKWQAQYGADLEIRTTRAFHDRFVVIDGKTCWHIGCSIKDAGGKAFMLSRLEDEANRDALMAQIADSWASGSRDV